MHLLPLIACTGAAPLDDTAGQTDPVEPTVQHFEGQSQYYGPGGAALGAPSEVLLRRTVTPADASLEEVVYTRDGAEVSIYTLLWDIDPAAGTWTFSFADAYGTFEGSGTFLGGETWAWNVWESVSTYVDGPYAGSYVTSADTVDAEGLVAHNLLRGGRFGAGHHRGDARVGGRYGLGYGGGGVDGAVGVEWCSSRPKLRSGSARASLLWSTTCRMAP
jgi:hypothetical protein